MGKLEDLILQCPGRGMDLLRPHLPEDFCAQAAEAILAWPWGTVLLTTGFYVAGRAETDGPPGTLFLALALRDLGFRPVVVTDGFCRDYFEPFQVEVCYVDHHTDFAALLADFAPVGLMAVERCGKNVRGDYANMRGQSVAHCMAPVDRLFDLATCPTVGVGDGGNEIGMGNLAAVIQKELPLVPCCVKADHLVIATVSNWGALGLCAGLGKLPDRQTHLRAYERALALGHVDGITQTVILSEDGFDLSIGQQLLRDLEQL